MRYFVSCNWLFWLQEFVDYSDQVLWEVYWISVVFSFRLVDASELSMAFILGDWNLTFGIVRYPVDTPTYQSFSKVQSLHF